MREREKRRKIVAKMNSLCDKEIIAALYEASAAGVQIDLIVRGICCLKVGIPGISENIRVRSIVGNFLEHSRIFYFYNDGQQEFYMGSADWMPRNLDRRVEILFPVEDEVKSKRACIIFWRWNLADNAKAHILNKDGEYEKIDKRGKVLSEFTGSVLQRSKSQKDKRTGGLSGKGVYSGRTRITAKEAGLCRQEKYFL